eukprot:1918522-Pyramimonas_sp.AAC.1
MHCCVEPSPPATVLGQLQNTVSAVFQYPAWKVYCAIAHRLWVEGLASGYAKAYIPTFVFFT